MGEVYRARDGRLKRDVALKVLHAAHHTPEHVQRFTREARAAGALNHPNILAVFDVGIEGQVPYVVSELLEGESLRHRLDRGPIPCRKALEYAIQVAHALAAAHDKGICHRDVKPGNVFILGDGRVKLLDFGLAKLDDTSYIDGSDETTASAISRAGMVFGTVGYMAPEQVLGEIVDHRADVFSLGAVLYEMLTGARAFQRATSVETMTAILREDPVNPLDLNPTLPAAVAAAVRRCLEKNKEERFQSARDLAFHLQQLDQATSGVQPRAVARGAPSRKWLGVLLALAAGLALGWALRHLVVPPPLPVTFHQLTFQRGRIDGARFGASGIVYSQTDVGPDDPTGESARKQPSNTWLLLSGNPQSREMLYSDYGLLAARGDALLLSKQPRFVRGVRFAGTRARATVFNPPRADVNRVEGGDLDDSGNSAIAVTTGDGTASRIEYPPGQPLCDAKVGSMHGPRISPDGKWVAFQRDPFGTGNAGNIVVVDRQCRERLRTREWGAARGIAWSARGDEVWFTAAPVEGANRALYAVSLEGKERTLLEAPGSLTIWDVAPDGRVLLSLDDERMVLTGRGLHARAERDLSVADSSGLASLSRDGTVVLFKDRFGSYTRPTDGSPATLLDLRGASPDDLSPDGRTVLATVSGTTLVAQSVTDAVEPDAFPRHGIEAYGGAFWFPDGQRILFSGQEAGAGRRSYIMDFKQRQPRRLTSEGTLGLSISRDGTRVAAMGPKNMSVWSVADGSSRMVPDSAGEERPVAWTEDGKALWVFRRGEVPAAMHRVDVATGERTVARLLGPADSAGVYSIDDLAVTADGQVYFYTYRRLLSQLYLVTGLR